MTLKNTSIEIVCSGCGAKGIGLLRQYLGNQDQHGKRHVRHFINHPPEWGLRFVDRDRLDFCPDCRVGLGSGRLQLVGTTVVEKGA